MAVLEFWRIPHMNIVKSTPLAAPRNLAPNATVTAEAAVKEKTDEAGATKPTALDAFSSGANKGGNIANTVMGAWNGGLAGVVTGGAIALGANAVSAAYGAISGTNPLAWSTLLNTATTTGLAALGGGAVGAVAGGFLLNKAGDFAGNIGANIARKTGGNENLGRAIGTVGTGVALGTIVGTSVLGVNGALISLGLGAAVGGYAYLNS